MRRTCQTDAKAEHSEPTIRIRCGGRLSDKSYSRDNRLVPPKSSYRRRSSAPRCRLILSWGWRRSQGFGCSPIKKLRELGSDRLVVMFFEDYFFRNTFGGASAPQRENFFQEIFVYFLKNNLKNITTEQSESLRVFVYEIKIR